MVVVFMGPICTGKSSVAELIREKTNIQVVTGKDYLRLASDEDEAWKLFLKKVKAAIHADPHSEESLIYILDDSERVYDLIGIKGVRFVKFSATLDAIRDRYEARMQGELPGIVIKMLRSQLDSWDEIACDVNIDSSRERDIKEMHKKL